MRLLMQVKKSPDRMCLNLDPDADVLVEGKGAIDFSVSMEDTEATKTNTVWFEDPPTLLEIETTDNSERTEGDSGNKTFTFNVIRSGTLNVSSSVNYSVSGSGTNAANSADKAEGDSGNTAFTFRITRSGVRSGTSSVKYTVSGSGGNAANKDDFGGSFPSETVNFAENDSSKTITINVSGDNDLENDEGFTVTLSNPSGTIIETATATGTIQTDDSNVSVAATSADKAEGDSGDTSFTFTVTRSGYTGGTSSVNYAVTGSGGDQADATDFGGSLPSGSVDFPISSTSQVITVTISGDTDVEEDEGFIVTLSSPTDTNLDTDTADGTIQNDDTRVDLGATSADKAEGNSGDIAFTFTVTRTGLVSGASSVDYVITGNGSDPADADDFGGTLPSGTVNFSASDTSKEITVNVRR